MRSMTNWFFLGSLLAFAGCKSDPPAAMTIAKSAAAEPLAAPSASAKAPSAESALAPYGEDDVLTDIDYCSQFWLGGIRQLRNRCDLVEPFWASGNVEGAVAKYKAGCENKDGKSCLLMIGALAHPQSPLKSKDKETYIIGATAYLAKACEYGEPHACVAVVSRYSCTKEQETDRRMKYVCTKPILDFLARYKYAELLGMLDEGCKKNHGPACTAQAEHAEKSNGSVDDVRNLYKRGCELGDARGCRAAYHSAKTFGAEAEMRAFEANEFAIAELACKRVNDCVSVAAAYTPTLADPEKLRRIRNLLTTACAKQDPDTVACFTLAEMQLKGAGGPIDVAHALPALQARCDRTIDPDDSDLSLEPISIGCRMLAMLYKEGNGVEKDLTKAKALLTRACMRKDTGNSEINAACKDLEALEK